MRTIPRVVELPVRNRVSWEACLNEFLDVNQPVRDWVVSSGCRSGWHSPGRDA